MTTGGSRPPNSQSGACNARPREESRSPTRARFRCKQLSFSSRADGGAWSGRRRASRTSRGRAPKSPLVTPEGRFAFTIVRQFISTPRRRVLEGLQRIAAHDWTASRRRRTKEAVPSRQSARVGLQLATGPRRATRAPSRARRVVEFKGELCSQSTTWTRPRALAIAPDWPASPAMGGAVGA